MSYVTGCSGLNIDYLRYAALEVYALWIIELAIKDPYIVVHVALHIEAEAPIATCFTAYVCPIQKDLITSHTVGFNRYRNIPCCGNRCRCRYWSGHLEILLAILLLIVLLAVLLSILLAVSLSVLIRSLIGRSLCLDWDLLRT